MPANTKQPAAAPAFALLAEFKGKGTAQPWLIPQAGRDVARQRRGKSRRRRDSAQVGPKARDAVSI